MLKKFIDGLIFGIGFGIVFVIICIVAIYFILPIVADKSLKSIDTSSSKMLNTVPAVHPPKNLYLGSTNITSSGFSSTGNLAIGDGKIIGNATSNGKPVKGLKLRLALNGSVYSTWATTDLSGKYIINIPYGDYIIEGFELDKSTADNFLPKMILHPQNPHSSPIFKVTSSSNGRGLNFKFVNPIIKKLKKAKYKHNEEIILEWESYPGASKYSVQIYEKNDPYAWSNNTLFKWSDRPELIEPRINLSKYSVKLKPGNFYTIDISASNKKHCRLSESATNHSGYDFEVIQ